MKSLQRIKKNKKQFSETFDENKEVCRGPKKTKKTKKNQFSETPREIKKSAEDQKNQKKTKKKTIF